MNKAYQRVQKADLRIFMFDISQFPHSVDPILSQLAENDIVVLNKEDLQSGDKDLKDAFSQLKWNPNKVKVLSCKTGKGVSEFLKALEIEVSNL